MRAMTIDGAGDGTRIGLADVPEPHAGASDLIVRVAAIGVNRADLSLDRTHFGDNEFAIAGSEFAGTVVAVGGECKGFKVGDRVMGLAPACYAELVAVRHELVMRVPDEMDWTSAASVPAWYMTAHNALMTVGEMRAGENVLVQGATSGAGAASLALARHFGAGEVVGCARSLEKLAQLGRLVERAHVMRLEGNWPEKVIKATGGGVQLVIDFVGGGALDGNLDCLTLDGRIVAVGRLGGQTDVLNLDKLARKRLQINGVSFRARSVEQKAAVVQAFEQAVLPAIASGKIELFRDKTFAFDEAAQAHDYVRANKHFGKVVIEVGL